MNTKRMSRGSGAEALARPLPVRPPVSRPPPPPARPTPAELGPAQLEELRASLLERRGRLDEAIEQRRAEERGTSARHEVGDEMDEAAVEGTASLTSKLLERDLDLRAAITHALAKFEDGTYGLCEGTGEPIGYARLRLQPWARYGVAYQEELELERRARGGV